jgi:SAM-dependent methyltransferase
MNGSKRSGEEKHRLYFEPSSPLVKEADGAFKDALRGYVSDAPYVRTYMQRLAPGWLDHVALLQGFAPPARKDEFAWCELECGQGVTPVVLAATHPRGRFFGIDGAPDHIEHAKHLAGEAEVDNATFLAADFAGARKLALPKFDYIVAHGVYSWIDAEVQQTLLGFIKDHLAPGGLVYLSYNALPGWVADLTLRQIVVEGGGRATGDSIAKVKAGLALASALRDAGARALAQSRIRKLKAKDPQYLAHEFLAQHAKPLFVTELRAATEMVGLVPVGSAHLIENYDSFVLRAAQSETLAHIGDENLRELARDCFLDTAFRADIFTHDAKRIGDAERERRLLASAFMLTRPAAAIVFQSNTPSGVLKFDNEGARRVVAELSQGPKKLGEIDRGSIGRRDILANALTLSAAGSIWPVESPGSSPNKLLAAILARLDGPEEILVYPLPCGAAIPLPRVLLRRLRDRRALSDYPGWKEHLDALSTTTD